MTAPVSLYPTPVVGAIPAASGLTFDPGGAGLLFNAGYPLTFPPGQPTQDLSNLFPTIMPEVEQIVYQIVNEACNSKILFSSDGLGVTLPVSFSIPPDVSLFKGMDDTYPIPVGPNAGEPVPPILVVRGWPAYPGQIPAIGVAESTSTDDPGEDLAQGGFAGDVFATDQYGNVLASCAYYAEPIRVTVVVELIHTNRDERDRLHDQLWRVIFPLRHLLASWSTQVRDVQVDAEKQDLPLDEQPVTMYVSLFTLQVSAEALIPTEIVPAGTIDQIVTTVTPTEITIPDAPPNYE